MSLIKGPSKSHTRRLARCYGRTRGTLVKQRINHLMSNRGVLQNAIRDFLRTVSIMYNAIYKCVFQRGKIISSFIAVLLEVWLNFTTAPEVASSPPLKRHYVNTHTYTHPQGGSLFPQAAERTNANSITLAEATAGNNYKTVNLNSNIISIRARLDGTSCEREKKNRQHSCHAPAHVNSAVFPREGTQSLVYTQE